MNRLHHDVSLQAKAIEFALTQIFTEEEKVLDGSSDDDFVMSDVNGNDATTTWKTVSCADDLWLVLTLQQYLMRSSSSSSFSYILKGWKNTDNILALSNKSFVREILKESTHVTPRVHSIWPALLDLVLQTTSIGSNDHTLSVGEFWKFMVEDSLFNSTHERKYLGLQIFQLLLPRLASTATATNNDIALLFTNNFMHCLITSLADINTHLHRIAKQTV